MSVSPIDSAIYGGLFTTAAMQAVLADGARLQRMLDVEAALARAQAKLGLIPASAAREITAKARLERFDPAAIRRGTELAGYPIVPLVKALSELCEGDAGRYVHWGATTQDIVDSALVLQIRDALTLIEADLGAILRRLVAMAQQYRDTPMAGRTHLQHALPITFGFKCAVWLAAIQRHARRLEALRREALAVQFGGAVGTLASLGEDGLRVLSALADELGLAMPPIAWHVARDGVAEVACFLGLLTGSLGKIATDVA
ncbi:MAG: lyase family protein, partial [Geminicoccales bacterium]